MRSQVWPRFIAAVCVLFAAGRLSSAVAGAGGGQVDFRAYYDVALAVVRRLNPYDIGNLVAWNWAEPPIVFPGYTALFLPFLPFEASAAERIFIAINAAAGLGLVILVLRRCGLVNAETIRARDWRAAAAVASVCAFAASSPFLMCLRHGQTSAIVGLCVLGPFLIERPLWARSILFGVAATLKYSMLPLLAPALLARRDVLVCVFGFAVFAALGLFPAFLGNDLTILYIQYIKELGSQTGAGFNTFEISGYNMLQLDFLSQPLVRMAAKLSVVAAAALAVGLSLRRGGGFGLHLLLLLASATMLLSYHRMYDMVLPLALLLAAGNESIRQGRWIRAAIAAIFVLLLLLPESAMYRAGEMLGGMLGGGGMIHLCAFREFKHLFPLYPLIAIGLTCYSFYLCVFERESIAFPIRPEWPFRSGEARGKE